jgi:hypothetical protein
LKEGVIVPNELIAALIAAILGLSGATLKRFGSIEKRIDQVELNVANNYISKDDFAAAQDRLFKVLDRFETKLDWHVFGEIKGPPKNG